MRRLVAAVLLAGCGAIAFAQVPPRARPGGEGLAVAPVLLQLAGSTRTVSTMVSNPGKAPITVQARVMAWTVAGGEDVYTPTRDIGLSPPLFRLAPGATQAVRLVSLIAPGSVERSYRLIIDQLPIEDAPGQLQMPVRMVLPMFVAPGPGIRSEPQLNWSARYDPAAGKLFLTASNTGTAHARILDLGYEADGAVVPVASGLAGYALPGMTREWGLAASHMPETITIVATADRGKVRATIAVAH